MFVFNLCGVDTRSDTSKMRPPMQSAEAKLNKISDDNDSKILIKTYGRERTEIIKVICKRTH